MAKPQIPLLTDKKGLFRSVLIRMFTNFGRELVFSADLCYNEANGKPPSRREPLDTCKHRGMGFARSLCNTKAKPAIKQNDK